MRHMAIGWDTSDRNVLKKAFKFMRARKAYITALSCLVVFVATYLLILPALTLDQDKAEQQGGIDVPQAEDVLLEQQEPADKDLDAELPEQDAVAEEEVSEPESEAQSAALSYSGKGFEITAEGEGLPEEAKIKAKEIQEKDQDYEALYQDALKAVDKDAKAFAFAKFYDISLMSDGEAIEPENPMDVTISYDKGLKADDADNIRVVHFAVNEETGEVRAKVLDPKHVDTKIKSGKMTETTFEAESFSVYAVVYTVDFHWDVDGETFDCSLPGGRSLTLGELVTKLNIAKDDTEEFLEGVDDVTFSSPELVWVGKADEETTFGALKDSNELDVQYSAELKDEDIDEINAQTVNAGDWALIGMKPFETEETLTVTMKDGEVFEIKVTDDQLKSTVLSASGDTYEVTVSYDESAGIPADAELDVREISTDSNEYAKNIKKVNKQLAKGDEEVVTNPVQFDIRIMSDGTKIEPKEGSTVNVEIKLARELFEDEDSEYNVKKNDQDEEKGQFYFNGEEITAEEGDSTLGCQVAHITEAGNAEIIGGVENSVEGDNLVMKFVTESFSDYLFDGTSDNGLYNLPTTIYVGDEIYMWHQAHMWVSNIGPVVTETKHNNSDDFKTVTAINTGTFRIYNRYNQNEYREIRVLPARTGTTPPSTIDTVNNASVGIKLDLFDYDLDGSLDSYFNNYNHGDHPVPGAFLNENGSINNGHNLKFWGSGIGNNHGSQNQYQQHGVTSIVKNTLDTGQAGGYPVLSTDNTSLSYLFTPSDGTDKKAYTNVDGLFKKEGDYYVYDSDQNYAYYDTKQGNGGRFKVYERTYRQKTGSETGSLQNKAIGFFPFHAWDEEYDLYVNWNKKLNHHFGLSMSVDFSLPKDPKAIVDTEGNPIVFEFSGDDDLWVFIDGKLAMDIGGIHQPTSGTINFQDQTVTVNGSEQRFDFNGLTDGNKHTLQVFYIERGGCDSNCKIKFNLTQYGDIHFDKVDKDNPNDKLAGAVFGIYKDSDCSIPLMENLKDGTSRAYVAESNAQGRVQFSDIPLGTYYLKELHAPEGYPVDNTVHTVQVYYDQTAQQVKVKVTIDGTDVEAGVNIKNKKPAPIDLGLHKVWQNSDGESIVAPEGAHATFEIKRIRNYETYTEQTIEGQGREVSHLTVGWIHKGETHVHAEYDLIAGTQATISWGYKDGYDGTVGYVLNGTEHTKDPVATNVYSDAFTMPAAGGTATFYVIDNSDDGEAITNINVAGSQYYGNAGGGVIHTFTTHSEPDPTFSYTGEHVTNNQVTLPINSNTWSYIFNSLPTFERGRVAGVDHDVSFNYSYFLEEVSSNSPNGTTVVYEDSKGNVISSPTDAETIQSGTLNITNKVPTGYLRIDKEVTYNGVSPVPDGKKSDLAGTYTFKVYTDENCSKPYKVIQGEAPNQQETDLVLTVTIGDDGVAKSSDTVKIPVGDYWIEEQTPTQTGVTPEENRIKVTITANQTTSEPAVASFTNNKEESDKPDEMAIELEKTFTGLPDASKIPGGYQAALTYTYQGQTVTIPLTGSSQGNVTCVKSNDDLTWHWRITQIPKTATNFGVYEENYDITGYTRITKINGNEVENPRTPQGVTVLTPEITMTNITSDYTTADNMKVFKVVDNQILLVRMTSHATVIVSPKSLSLATRTAIEKMIQDNGGKIPGDSGANATWVQNFVYFSHEIQGNSFSYGGRTIYFDGDYVKIPHNASSHEVRVDIGYTSTSAENSFTIENDYTEVPTKVDVLKVEKGKETTSQLSGAVFELRKLKDIAPAQPGGTLSYVEDNNHQVIVTSETTGSNGRLTFEGLTYGVYEIKEVSPPAGYVQAEEVIIYLKVDGGEITYIQKGSGKPSTWEAAPNEDSTATVYYMGKQSSTNATFRVSNPPGQELPNAGGPGTTWIYLLGCLLFIGCGVLLVARRRMEH